VTAPTVTTSPTLSTRTHRPPAALHRAAPCGLRQRALRPLPVAEPDNSAEWVAHARRCALECLEVELLPVHQWPQWHDDHLRRSIHATAAHGRRWWPVRAWAVVTGREPAGYRQGPRRRSVWMGVVDVARFVWTGR